MRSASDSGAASSKLGLLSWGSASTAAPRKAWLTAEDFAVHAPEASDAPWGIALVERSAVQSQSDITVDAAALQLRQQWERMHAQLDQHLSAGPAAVLGDEPFAAATPTPLLTSALLVADQPQGSARKSLVARSTAIAG